MLNNIPVFKIYSAMAKHAMDGQSVSATNIANANVPGFKAKEIEPFEAFMARLATQGGAGTSGAQVSLAEGVAKPNGNTVSLEQEVFNSAQALGQHNLALSVYSKSLDLMRTALGRR